MLNLRRKEDRSLDKTQSPTRRKTPLKVAIAYIRNKTRVTKIGEALKARNNFR